MNHVKKKRRSRLPALLGCLLFAALFVIAVVGLTRTWRAERRAESGFETLRQAVPVRIPEAADDEPAEEPPVRDLTALAAENADLIGWLSIADTPLDYPVMFAPDRPDFYLHRDFAGADSPYGVPYLDEDCDPGASGGNLIVYGHHVKGGAMFGSLADYKERAYAEAHPAIRWDGVDGQTAFYEVAVVFLTTADAAAQDAFDYARCTQFVDEAAFQTFLAGCRQNALYETEVPLAFGDSLLTLSTCDYARTDGRLAVLAKRRT